MTPSGYAAFRQGMEAGMARMHADMHHPAPGGSADQDFLAMMIPHHEGAVEMARLLLLHGRDALVRQLAEAILAAQTVEIASMRARLAALTEGPDLDTAYPAAAGLRG